MLARAARLRRPLAPALALLLVAPLLAVLPQSTAQAAVDRAFTPVFTANTNGSILLRGNSSMTCQTAVSGCTSAKAAGLDGAANNNNNFSMVYTDVDAVAATVNSSSATVTLPTGANVIFAGLYWAGDEKGATTLDKTKVKIATPKAAYTQVTASETTTSTANSGGATPYQSYTDVTSLVKAGGSGVYTVADIRAAIGSDKFAGWSLVIAINDPAAPMRNLTIFDGFGVVQSSDPTVSIPVSGFQTPPAGTVKSQVGAVTYEGDFGYTGDQLTLNTTALTNAKNPVSNSFNSTITEEGVAVAGRTPGDANAFGVDIDRFDATGVLANGATSATLKLTTSSDTFYPGVVTFATDLYSPKLDITKSVVDVNGGTAEPGDVLQYTLDLKNTGQDAATLTRLLDSVPTNSTYVAGSLTLDGKALTDALDTDVGQLVADTAQGKVRVNLGTGATAATGGIVAVGATAKITFKVKIDAALVDDVDIVNVAAADYTGAQTGLGISSVSNATATGITAPRADLRVTKTSIPTTVQRGQPVAYTVTVINDGPKPAQAVVLTDTLPTGVVPTATSTQGTCTVAGAVVTCAVGDMAVGATVTVTVKVADTTNAPDPLLDTAVATAATIDPDATDSTGTASTVVNKAPVAVNDAAETATNTAVTVAVTANDTDPDSNALTVTAASITGTAHGTVTVGADGKLTYTPATGYAGPETISYTISDGRGGTATATVAITVRNAAPVAANDESTTTPATAVKIPVLGNDTDANIPGTAQVLSISAVSTPAGGTAVVDGKAITYTPNATFKGTDTFTYTVSDGAGGTATATVKVAVPNAAPVAADDARTTAHATAVSIDVLANDSDNNGDALTIDSFTQPANGTGAVTKDGKNLVYTPPTGFRGIATFTYATTDGTATATATVRVTVLNAAPKAGDDTAATDTNTAQVVDVLGNDTDVNGDTLIVTGTSTPAHGKVVVSANGKTVTYTPTDGYRGPDSFTYTISDGNGGTATATANLTVRNAPPKAVEDVRTTAAGSPVTIAVLANDSDLNGDPLTLSDVPTKTDSGATITRSGDAVTYTPAKDFLGTDTFTYKVSDGAGGVTTGTVRISVVNTDPVANPDAVTVTAAKGGSIPLDVLANDTDANGDALTISSFTTGQAKTVVVKDGKLVYSYPDDFAGVDQISYTASDGKGGLSTSLVTITIVNPAPTPVNDAASTPRNTPVLIDAIANDTDPNGDAIRVSKVDPPASGATVTVEGGKVRYVPAAGFQGIDTVTYTVLDARGGIATAQIRIEVSNGVPIAVNDAASTDLNTAVTIDVRANDTDPEKDPLTVTATTTPANGSIVINSNGTLTYTPRPGYAGPDSVTYTVDDGRGGTASAVIALTVRNALPVANPDRSATEPNTLVRVPALANDTDPNIPATAQRLLITSITAPANGKAVLVEGGTAVDVTPANGFRGSLTLNYTIADGAGGTATSTITVEVANAGPVAAPDRIETPFQTTVLIPVTGNDADPNGDTLTVVEVGSPKDSGGNLRGRATIVDGVVRYIPATGFTGEVTFDYKVSDGAGGSASSTVTVVVGNGTPVADPDTASTVRRTPVEIDAVKNDSDPNGDTLTIVGVVGVDPKAGTAIVDRGGNSGPGDDRIVFTAAPGFVGTTTFTYQVADGRGGLASASVTVVVTNDGPKAKDDSAQTSLEFPVEVPVLGNDSDPDGDALVVGGVSEPAHGSALALPNGTVRYTPAQGWAGVDTFTYLARDPFGATAPATVTVLTLNALPDAVADQAGTKPDEPVTVLVLANDTDPNVGFTSQALRVTAVGQPAAGGKVEIVDDGAAVRFTPAKGFAGTVEFTYTIRDGATDDIGGPGLDTATVTVVVDNAKPVAAPDFLGAPFGMAVTVPVLGNDSDPNADPLTITDVSDPLAVDGGAKAGKAVVVDGGIRYTPPATFTGLVTFTYAISDGKGGTASATVTVEVGNGPPRAVEDAATTTRDTQVKIATLANDSDANGDPLRIVGATGGVPGSVLTVTTDTGVDKLLYTPAPGFAGIDIVEYTIADGRGGESTAQVRITVPNGAPVFTTAPGNASQTVDVGSPLAPLKVTDPDGDRITVEPIGGKLPPGVSLNSDGSFTGTPTVRGEYAVTVAACDDRLPQACSRQQLTIVVSNQAPVAVDDAAMTDTGIPVEIRVLGNDTDRDGDALIVHATTAPVHGSVVSLPGGDLRYTPDAGYAGPDVFTYTVDDGNGGSATATVRLTVTNAKPDAVDDKVGTGPGERVVVPVLDNDTDPNLPGSLDQALTVTAVTQPAAGGKVKVTADGTAVSVQPAAGFRGELVFTYTIADGKGGADTATVTVVVSNAAPVIVNDEASTPYLTPVLVPVLGNDTDPNDDPLTIRAVGTPVDAAGKKTGTVEIIGGTLRYFPPEGFSGPVTFPYTAGDDKDSSTATVTVIVLDAPPVAVAEAASTDRNTAVEIDVLDNDSDPNRDLLTIVGISGVDPAAGAVRLDTRGTDDPSDDVLVFRPNRTFAGTTTFTYEISDGRGERSSAVVTVTVENTKPVAGDDRGDTSTDTPVRIDRAANDSDVDDDPLTVVDVTRPMRGTVTIATDGALTYTPNPGWSGGDRFDYTVSDGRGGSATATVIVVTANADPIAGRDSAGTGPDEPVTIRVLEDDTDANIPGTEQKLTISEVGQPKAGGKVERVDDNTAVKFTPDKGFQGEVTFEYVVADGAGGFATAVVTVVVSGAKPAALDDQYATPYLKPVILTPLANDTDPNGDALTVADMVPPAKGTVTADAAGNLVYNPPAGFSGPVSFGYTVRDATGLTATATITVVVGNGLPRASDDSAAGTRDAAVPIDVLGNDTDPNADPLRIVGTGAGAPGSVVALDDRGTDDPSDDVIVYTPAPGFAGADSFTYTVRDPAGDSSTATVTVVISNAPPAFTDAPSNRAQTVEVGGPLASLQVTDPDKDKVTIRQVGGNLPPGVTLNEDGSFAGEPTARGEYTVTVEACDDRVPSACVRRTVRIEVTNQVPVLVDDVAVTDTDVAAVIRVLDNDSDRDGDALTVLATSIPAHGSVVVLAGGDLLYTPDAGYAGPDAFTYTADDGNGGTVTATARVTVNNAKPDAVDDTAGAGPGEQIVVPVLTNDTDPNLPGSADQALRITAVVPPSTGGTVRVNAERTAVIVEPAPGFRGDLVFSYEIGDGQGGTDTAKVTVTVTNAVPVVVADTGRTPYLTPVTVDVLRNDVDPNGDPLSIRDVGDPVDAAGEKTGSAKIVDGRLEYTPPSGFSGTVTFPYTAGDDRDTGTAVVTIVVADAPPAPDPDTARTDRNTAARIDVLGNDSDPNRDVLTIVGVSGVDPDAGTVVLDTLGNDDPGDDVLVFTPNRAFAGETTFSYEIDDGHGERRSATVTVTVINTAPTAGDDAAGTATDTPVRIDRGVNDADPDADPLTVSAVTDPKHGSVTIGTDGVLTYTPAPGWAGEDEFDYTVSDGRGAGATATVKVITANADPVAGADKAGTGPGKAVTIPVLANDTDPNIPGTDQALTISAVTQPSAGGKVDVVDSAAGNDTAVKFTPGKGFQGEVTFTYTVTDGAGGTKTTTVTVIVDGAVPGAVDDAYATSYAAPVFLTPLDNDTDPNGDALTVAAVEPPAKGTVGTDAEGRLVYTPPAGFSGTVSFGYTVRDATGLTATATITVVVGNGRPTAANDLAGTIRDTAVPIDVRANDSDPNSEPLRIVAAGPGAPGSLVAVDDGGTPDDPSDDVVVYTPPPGFAGTDTFSYTVRDGAGDEAAATVTVTVPNAAPVFADVPGNSAQRVEVGGAPAALQVSDPDKDKVTVTVVGGELPPGVTLNTNGSFDGTPTTRGEYTFTVQACDDRLPPGCSRTPVTVTVSNQVPTLAPDTAVTDTDTPIGIDVLVNDGDLDGDVLAVVTTSPAPHGSVRIEPGGTLTYTPDPGFAGTDAFTYTVDDGNGALVATTVSVTVRNALPVATDDLAGTGPGDPVTVPVLANDADANIPGTGQALRITDLVQPVKGGTVKVNGDRTAVIVEPAKGFRGDLVFTYEVGDGAGGKSTAKVTVSVSNAAPVIVDDSVDTPYLTPVTIDVLRNDEDPNGDKLTIRQVGAPVDPSGAAVGTVQIIDGKLVFTPPPGFSGLVTFPYTAGDDKATGTKTVTVAVGDAPPKALPDAADTDRNSAVDIAVLGNDTDANGDVLSIVGVAGVDPAAGSVTVVTRGDDPRPVLVFTPNRAFAGETSFYYEIDDGRGQFSSAIVTVTVRNSAPVAQDDSATTATDEAVRIDVGANDSDPDGDDLTVAVTGPPAHGSVTVGVDGSLTYTPAQGWAGPDSFVYTVSDGRGGSDRATVTVTTANADPKANGEHAGTGPDKAVTIPVLANDTDPNIPGTGQELTVIELTQPLTGGKVDIVNTDAGDDTGVRFTPEPGFQGQVTFTYTVSDGERGTATATVTVTVDGAAPGANDDFYTTSYNKPVVLRPLANDTDPNGDALAVSAVAAPAGGTVGTDADGNLVYTPAVGFSGPMSFGYTVRDATGRTATATITVVVGNGVPVAANDAATTTRDTAVRVDVGANDSDPNKDPLTIEAITGGAAGSVVAVEDGGTPDDPSDDVVRYTPPPGFAGTDTFTYTVRDPAGGEATATVTVTVPNAAPVFTDAAGNVRQDVVVGAPLVPLILTDADGDPVTLTLIKGELPVGVSLNPDGTFTGTPTRPGSSQVIVRACDDRLPPACTDQVLTIVVGASESTVTPASPADPADPSTPAVTPPVPPATPDDGVSPANNPPKVRPDKGSDDGVIGQLAHTGASNVGTLLMVALLFVVLGSALQFGARTPVVLTNGRHRRGTRGRRRARRH